MGETPGAVVSYVAEQRIVRGNLSSSSNNAIVPKERSSRMTRVGVRVKGYDIVSVATGFLVKVVALEAVRRASMSAGCPIVWRGIQALQFLCYPPLKWFHRWIPFKNLIRGVQLFSRPLLLLSVASAFSEQSDIPANHVKKTPTSRDTSVPSLQLPIAECSTESNVNEDAGNPSPENWLIHLHKELEKQQVSVPERLGEEDLKRFYEAANRDLSKCVSMVKKTIQWRRNYRFMTIKQLQNWSNVVFWHGYDVRNRPCLIVRLGFACGHLSANEKPSFLQAIITQVENGVVNMVDKEKPHITVVVDCEGITPLRVPMQMVRSCASILVENYPSHLGNLYVIRLPPVVRVIAQTIFQVLRPGTRKKMKVAGRMYKRVLSEALQTLPAFFGGDCVCKMCSEIGGNGNRTVKRNDREIKGELWDQMHIIGESEFDSDQLFKTAVVGALMLWIFISFCVIYRPPLFALLQ